MKLLHRLKSIPNREYYLIAGLLVIGAVALILSVAKKRIAAALTTGVALPFSPILNPMTVRVDAGGNGHFESSRIGHIHQGTDWKCKLSQPIYAPFSGTVVRLANPYATDLTWHGFVFHSESEGYEAKFFYCNLAVPVGTVVSRGAIIGFAQGISAKYTSGVTDHIHLEIRKDGILLNPELLFTHT